MLTPALRSLGPAGLMPMLERIALIAEPQDGLADTAWLAWRASLLDAVGMLRDARAAAVLSAVIARHDLEPPVLDAAVRGFARLATDEVADNLVTWSRTTDGRRRQAVLAAMGHCRRLFRTSP